MERGPHHPMIARNCTIEQFGAENRANGGESVSQSLLKDKAFFDLPRLRPTKWVTAQKIFWPSTWQLSFCLIRTRGNPGEIAGWQLIRWSPERTADPAQYVAIPTQPARKGPFPTAPTEGNTLSSSASIRVTDFKVAIATDIRSQAAKR